ncbi:MAG: serine/threonine-protein kinase [Gemmatimonadales bacterium]
MNLDRPGPSAAVFDRLFLDFQSALAGRYSLERELGRGGMGVVYLAREVRLDRPVAIKLLPPTRAADGRLRERFLREARTAAKLSHPNIIPIHAVDELGEFVFFAMAYVEGETLTDRVRRRGPLAPSEAGQVLREVAWALAYAHGQGVVHRDVKPDNILLEAGTGRALVMDFGIAAVVRGAGGLDGGEVIGTPEFMSPEQALGERVDARSDLYALGLVGFFALSGRLPFERGKPTEVLAKQVTEAAPPLASVAAGLPRRLAQVIDQCLVKDAEGRPQSADELVQGLGRVLEQRRELPVALRVFVKRGSRIHAGAALLYLWLLSWMSGAVAAFLAPPGLRALLGWGMFLTGVILVPLSRLVARARRLLRSGFGQQDLELGFRTELEHGREERAYEYGVGPSRYERVVRVVAVIGLGTAAIALARAWTGLGAVGGWWTLFGLSVTSGLGATLLAVRRLQERRDIETLLWSRLWKGRFGRWLFALAGWGLPAGRLPSSGTHRPTELALGMAAEKLFEELPKETRAQLRELPEVLHRLEDDARRMRARLEELQDALAGTGDGGRGTGEADVPSASITERRDRVLQDLIAERDLVQQRLRDAVTALETIRLNLLRLHAGSGSVQRVTTDLGLARDVAQEIDRLLEGRREVEDELRRRKTIDDGPRRTR